MRNRENPFHVKRAKVEVTGRKMKRFREFVKDGLIYVKPIPK